MRLIDADELKTILSIRRTIETIQHAVDNAPTIDAVPVWHGRWIDRRYGGSKGCSECGYVWTDFGYPNYCPDCGARMDEETEE